MRKSEQKKILQEETKLREDIRKIHDSYEQTDREFNKWKEGVLKFEYSKHCANDCSGGDDRVRDGQRIRTAEDEDDIQ